MLEGSVPIRPKDVWMGFDVRGSVQGSQARVELINQSINKLISRGVESLRFPSNVTTRRKPRNTAPGQKYIEVSIQCMTS